MPVVRRAIHISLIVGLLMLGWEAVAFGVAVNDRRKGTQVAASHVSANALVLGTLAQRQLKDGLFEAAETARRALRRDATNAAAAGTLSIIYGQQGDAARSRAMLAYAEGLSRRDLSTQLWAIEIAVQRGDIPGALRHYDIALRVGKSMPPLLFPVLASAGADPEIRAPLARMLAKGTPWKSSFFDYLSAHTQDIQAAARLVEAVYVAGGAIDDGPMSILTQRLVEAGAVNDAWALFTYGNPRAERTALRNGDFSAMPELPTPFEWRLEDNGDARAEILRGDRGGEMHVEARSGAGGTVASQQLVLPPGGYTLTFMARDGASGNLGASIVEISCVASRRRIGEAQLRGADKGRQGMHFVVPVNCPSQSLSITLNSGGMETGIDGTIDDVILTSSIARRALQ